jgi:hypothetical protein
MFVDRGHSIEQNEIELYNGAVDVIPHRMTWGQGDIIAPDLDDESLQIVTAAVTNAQAPIDDDGDLRSSSCFDARELLGLGDGTPPEGAPNRSQMAGSELLTGFMMVELLPTKWSLYPRNANEMSVQQRFGIYSRYFRSMRQPGAHGPVCGAAAGFPVLVENQFRLFDGVRQDMKGVMGEFYNPAVHEAVASVAEQKILSNGFRDWSTELVDAVVPRTHRAFEHLHDDGKGVHGHQEIVVIANNRTGTSLDKRKFVAPDGQSLQGFQFDTPAIADLAVALSATQEEVTAMMHAGVAMQHVAAGTLGRNFRTIVLQPKNL